MTGKGNLIHIVTCQSLEREMGLVAQEFRASFSMKVFPSSCHRDPEGLGRLIEDHVKHISKNARVFIAYGGCYNSSAEIPPGASTIPALNCAAIMLGGNEAYSELAPGSYFLTPHLALNWREYFLGKGSHSVDEKTASRLAKWFKPIERVIFIEFETSRMLPEYQSAQDFVSIILKPLIRVPGDLGFLKNVYSLFLNGHSFKWNR